eukprot:4005031-Pleurochrysis_carterae.AAC.1
MYHSIQQLNACKESPLKVRRTRLAEQKSAGFLPPVLVVLLLALGGENSPVRRPRRATGKRARGR